MNKVNVSHLVLASASPRRKQLLEQLGWEVETYAVDIDESPLKNEAADMYCLRMAQEKAMAARQLIQTNSPVITADTIVVFNGNILGKPKDASDALRMLKKLSGQTHQVFSAVAVTYGENMEYAISRNTVKFVQVNEAILKAYIDTEEPMDKAGAYAIQGKAAMWINHIEGSYSSIMGLPLFETTQLLSKLDIISPLGVL